MSRKAKPVRIVLQALLLTSVPLLIYLIRTDALGFELGMVVLMLILSMGLLFASEKEDEQPRRKPQPDRESAKVRSRS